jgi:hypothetical protein
MKKRISWLFIIASFSVFKIYNIEDEKFEEKLNLRVGKNLNLNYSSTDVAWNHIEGTADWEFSFVGSVFTIMFRLQKQNHHRIPKCFRVWFH